MSGLVGNPFLLTSAGAAGYQISRSLRFNSSDSAYCSRVPSSSGNRRTFTWSGWIKRGTLTTGYQTIFGAGTGLTTWGGIRINNSPYHDKIQVFEYIGGWVYDLTTTAVFRDPSAWYHLLVAVDTTQATASNRVKIYINGAQLTAFDVATYPAQNTDLFINSTNVHTLGTVPTPNQEYFSGYLAECYLIDGQQLTPSSFTEVSATTGQLIPKKYTGTATGNSFWLPFSDNSAATATTLGKDGFLLGNNWTPFNLSIATGAPISVASATGALPIYNTTDTYGATKGTGTRTDSNSSSIVLAIPMDGANNGTTFTDESATIKGSGVAKSITRYNCVTSTTQSKYYSSSGYFVRTSPQQYLEIPAFLTASSTFTFEIWIYATVAPPSASDSFTLFGDANAGYSGTRITSALGYGNGSNGVIGTYFPESAKSAIDCTIQLNTWYHYALSCNSGTLTTYLNGVAQGTTSGCSFSSAGLTYRIGANDRVDYGTNIRNFGGYLQDHRVYLGVAKYTSNFNPPANPQQAALIGAGNDSLVDTPTSYGTDTGAGGEVRGNYCTWNPLDSLSGNAFSNGNLDFVTSSSNYGTVRGTISVSSGKWYWEVTKTAGAAEVAIGIIKSSASLPSYVYATADGYSYNGNWNGNKGNAASTSSYGANYNDNDVIGVALDLDAGTLTFYKNGASQGVAFTGLSGSFSPAVSDVSVANTATFVTNFGQRPFAYTAPSGFKALCDTNLPAPVVAKPSEVMDVALWSGTGATQSITFQSGLSPDFVWIKARNAVANHVAFDVIRGANKAIYPSLTNAEDTYTATLTSFNSSGFTLGYDDWSGVNASGRTYVGWAWDAGSSTVTNTQGSITSSVRANASSGFSVVTYTVGNNTSQTIGHGLGVAPQLIIVKERNQANNWQVYHASLGNGSFLYLNSTNASGSNNLWNNTSPTSTVFSIRSGGSANFYDGKDHVAYCFAPVAGYSSFGSYTGNGSADGPFVFTGFRPRFLMYKSSTAAEMWAILDAARPGHNAINQYLFPNSSAAEGSAVVVADFLSNGFKIRYNAADVNTSGGVYIYAAFAENPFQFSRAR